MSESNANPGDSTEKSRGPDGIENANESDHSNDPLNGKPVSIETHRKLLSEKKKREEQLEIALKKVSDLEKEKKASLEAELKEKEDWKKIAELREQEKIEVETKYTSLTSEIQEAAKFQSLLRALPGRLDQKYYSLVDTRDIVIDPNTGEPDPSSVKKVADSFNANFGELVVSSGKARLPYQAASGSTQSMTEELWKSLSGKEKKERLPEYVESLKQKRGN